MASFIPLGTVRRSAQHQPSELASTRRLLRTVESVLLTTYRDRDMLSDSIAVLETKLALLRRQVLDAESTPP